jgi:hypothetical protein
MKLSFNPKYGLFTAVCVLALALAAGSATAQIVNVQPVIGASDDDGLTVELGGSVDYKTGNVDLLLARGSLLGLYRSGDHRIISSSMGEVGIKDDTEFLERVFTHLRWQCSVNEWLTWETYGQVASDEYKSLALRALAGTGGRVELLTGPAVSAAVGLAYMFEHEETIGEGGTEGVTSDNHRASFYVTGKFAVSPLLSLGNTTYYQPRVDAFLDDFRVASETTFNVMLTKKLALSLGWNIGYDSEPPAGAESLDSATRVALKLSI